MIAKKLQVSQRSSVFMFLLEPGDSTVEKESYCVKQVIPIEQLETIGEMMSFMGKKM
jgi:hypothetical protein